MLTNFPFEIILNIARRLDFHDKLTLTTTCHKLGALIVENCLYETLNIKDHDITETVIKKFKNKERKGSQVRYLKLCFDVLSDDTYRQLPDIFPKVIRLVNYSDTEGPRDHYTVRELLKWKDALQYFDVGDNLFKLARLIEKNTFSQLKYLRLSTHFFLDMSLYKTDLKLLECISHAPLLDTLELYFCEVNLDFLESVHNSCSYLKKLILEKVLLVFCEESLPQIMEPASRLECFTLKADSAICDRNALLPNYILRKYPNLQTLDMLSSPDDMQTENTLKEFFSIREGDFIANYPVALTYLQDQHATWDAYRDDDVELEFIQLLPKSITTLKLHADLFNHVLYSIQKAGLQLSTLELSNYCLTFTSENSFEKEDIMFLTTQTSLKTLKFATGLGMEYSGLEIVSSTVTKLHLVLQFPPDCNLICIAWILSAFPAIKKLDIDTKSALYYEEDVNTYKPNYNLTELNINHTLSNPTLLNVIAKLAPNIRHLGFSVNDIPKYFNKVESRKHLYNYPVITDETYETKYYHVDIINFDLDTFKLSCDLEKKEDYLVDIYYEIVNGKQVKRFIVSGCHRYITVIRNKNDPRLKKTTKVRVSCQKINKLIIENTIVVTFKDNDISLNL